MSFSQTDENLNFIVIVNKKLFFNFQIIQNSKSSFKTDLQIKKKMFAVIYIMKMSNRSFWTDETSLRNSRQMSKNLKKIKKKHFYWKIDKRAICWKHFDKKFSIENDISKIICRRCDIILKHFSFDNNINTASMHLKNRKYIEISKIQLFSQLTLKKIWNKIIIFLI